AEAAAAVTDTVEPRATVARPARSPARIVLLHANGRDLPRWITRAGARELPLPAMYRDGLGNAQVDAAEASLAGELADAECVLVDAGSLDPIRAARRVYQADADIQVVIVLEREEQRRSLERSILFSPGI